jgi:hypothetical protein
MAISNRIKHQVEVIDDIRYDNSAACFRCRKVVEHQLINLDRKNISIFITLRCGSLSEPLTETSNQPLLAVNTPASSRSNRAAIASNETDLPSRGRGGVSANLVAEFREKNIITREIMALHQCNKHGCTARSKYCWKDPSQGDRHLAIHPPVLSEWTQTLMFEDDPLGSLRNQPPPAVIQDQLRRHGDAKDEAKKRRTKTQEPTSTSTPTPATGPITNFMIGGMPPYGAMYPGMQPGMQPGMPPWMYPAQPPVGLRSPDRSSLPSDGSSPSTCIEWCQWIITKTIYTAPIKDAILSAGQILDINFMTPKTTYELIKKDGQAVRDMGIKQGIITILGKKKTVQKFLRSREGSGLESDGSDDI